LNKLYKVFDFKFKGAAAYKVAGDGATPIGGKLLRKMARFSSSIINPDNDNVPTDKE
jgi:hypothetical protein